MTESQKAFEETIKYGSYDLSKDAGGDFSNVATHLDFVFWSTAWKASRKQALEDAAACCIRKPYKSEGCLLPPPMMADEARIRIKELIK